MPRRWPGRSRPGGYENCRRIFLEIGPDLGLKRQDAPFESRATGRVGPLIGPHGGDRFSVRPAGMLCRSSNHTL